MTIRLKLISPSKESECRCYSCNKLLAKIKQVDNLAIIEIKCTKTTCRTLNVFRIEKNLSYNENI
jgi:phage FluMu protein Com